MRVLITLYLAVRNGSTSESCVYIEIVTFATQGSVQISILVKV